MHTSTPGKVLESWKAMVEWKKEGLWKSIVVSLFKDALSKQMLFYFILKGLLVLKIFKAIHSKSDLWTFDESQTKPLWKLEMLQKLPLKNFLYRGYKSTQLVFLWQCFLNIFTKQTLNNDFSGLHKNNNCVSPFPLF